MVSMVQRKSQHDLLWLLALFQHQNSYLAESLHETEDLRSHTGEEANLDVVCGTVEQGQTKDHAPLSFTSHLQNTEALAGETVDLYCDLSDIGLEVTWLKDNQTLSEADGRYQVVNQDHTYHLVIPSVTPNDSGQYTVQAGELQSTAVLEVLGELSMYLGHSGADSRLEHCPQIFLNHSPHCSVTRGHRTCRGTSFRRIVSVRSSVGGRERTRDRTKATDVHKRREKH